jgi:hypothetical protein
MTNVVFDSNDIQTASILLGDLDHESLPEKDAKIYAMAHAHKSSIPIVNYPRRVIRAEGTLLGTSISNLDSLIDTFKGYFTGKDKNLDVDYAGGTRRYIATVARLEIDRPKGLTHAEFEIEWWCTSPWGQATSNTTANNSTNITTQTANYAHTYIGTAPVQYPVITITIDSGTGLDGYLTIKNQANNQGITIIGQTFVATDVIEIDTKNRTVKKNGVEIDFIGSFPELSPGSRTLVYADGFTTRQYDITVAYLPLYL